MYGPRRCTTSSFKRPCRQSRVRLHNRCISIVPVRTSDRESQRTETSKAATIRTHNTGTCFIISSLESHSNRLGMPSKRSRELQQEKTSEREFTSSNRNAQKVCQLAAPACFIDLLSCVFYATHYLQLNILSGELSAFLLKTIKARGRADL